MDGVGNGGKHWFKGGLAGSVRSKVGASRIRVAINKNNIQALGGVGVAKAWVRDPVLTEDLFAIEPHLLVQRAAEAMKRGAFGGPAEGLRIDDQTAIVRT